MENKPENNTPTTDITAAAKDLSFAGRCHDTKKTRWIRFALVTALYIAWVIWLGNYWFLLALPLLFDIYITGYIPFTWWKKSKNAVVRTVMSWVDAIVYALILVYFIFAFIGQNYQIPSSSLEKTLLIGDYLWVNKMVYGPRVPMTPVNFPLVHNTLPILGCNSYASWPQNGYRRLKGLRNVETGDIVVFNFPAGDTIATKYEESPEYYELLVRNNGWAEVNTNKEKYGDIVYRPVDRRVNFVKRAVGLPGQRLRIADDILYIDGVAQKTPENAQFQYVVSLNSPMTEETARELGISATDISRIDGEFAGYMAAQLGTDPGKPMYVMPLTQSMLSRMTQSGLIAKAERAGRLHLFNPGALFPEELSKDWTLSDYGGDQGILIPRKGMTVRMDPASWALYRRVIRNYEGHTDARLGDDGKVYIDGKPVEAYTFAMDYYFMMGDNRDMSQDSRFWGFVPEDHIVGTPMLILASFDQDRSWTDGKIRWNRIFRTPNPDKK